MLAKNKLNINIGIFRNHILVVVCGLLALASIVMTIENATNGTEMSKLEKKEALLSDRKRTIEESLVKTFSMAELQSRSTEYGFVKPQNLVYFSDVEPVAKLP